MALVFLLVFQEPLNYGGIYNKSHILFKKSPDLSRGFFMQQNLF